MVVFAQLCGQGIHWPSAIFGGGLCTAATAFVALLLVHRKP